MSDPIGGYEDRLRDYARTAETSDPLLFLALMLEVDADEFEALRARYRAEYIVGTARRRSAV
jgi:hypothetical protein